MLRRFASIGIWRVADLFYRPAAWPRGSLRKRVVGTRNFPCVVVSTCPIHKTLNALLQDNELLTAVLTCHVAPGSLRAASVVDRDSIETGQGQSPTVTADDAGVRIDEARVTKTDILASNGAIHVIDTVMLPS